MECEDGNFYFALCISVLFILFKQRIDLWITCVIRYIKRKSLKYWDEWQKNYETPRNKKTNCKVS